MSEKNFLSAPKSWFISLRRVCLLAFQNCFLQFTNFCFVQFFIQTDFLTNTPTYLGTKLPQISFQLNRNFHPIKISLEMSAVEIFNEIHSYLGSLPFPN